MKNKKKTVTIIAIIGIGLAIIGGIGFYTCYHTWNAATCTRPRTCSICGKTEGESKGHTWSNATCTKPQTFGNHRCTHIYSGRYSSYFQRKVSLQNLMQ